MSRCIAGNIVHSSKPEGYKPEGLDPNISFFHRFMHWLNLHLTTIKYKSIDGHRWLVWECIECGHVIPFIRANTEELSKPKIRNDLKINIQISIRKGIDKSDIIDILNEVIVEEVMLS
jgi:hypothetical protein